MTRRLGHHALAGSLALFVLLVSLAWAARPPRHRVVVEVNTAGADQWQGILNNVENLQRAFGRERIEIEVVAHGNGLGMLLAGSSVQDRVAGLAASQVVFAACQNTMRRLKIPRERIVPAAITVDSGVAEVVRKQEAGWAYLKAGE